MVSFILYTVYKIYSLSFIYCIYSVFGISFCLKLEILFEVDCWREAWAWQYTHDHFSFIVESFDSKTSNTCYNTTVWSITMLPITSLIYTKTQSSLLLAPFLFFSIFFSFNCFFSNYLFIYYFLLKLIF